MRGRITEEEKIAQKLSELVSDLRIDLEQVGIYFARVAPNVAFNRLVVVLESAQHERLR